MYVCVFVCLYTLEPQLPNFGECWWDHVCLSVCVFVCLYTLEPQLPNFGECWWDHVCLSVCVFVCLYTLEPQLLNFRECWWDHVCLSVCLSVCVFVHVGTTAAQLQRVLSCMSVCLCVCLLSIPTTFSFSGFSTSCSATVLGSGWDSRRANTLR